MFVFLVDNMNIFDFILLNIEWYIFILYLNC